ncbi:hypothetical protein [Zavarzinella formosa]|uniref:hypothetical protein n=1 Tax=Zavarzinella formosa TaxID=360055 RepID=UPI00031D3F5A|nr:hypothetical protein [Zavarzinella formosa]
MGLFDSDTGKRRLLTIELPAIEKYNEGRDTDFRVRIIRAKNSLTLCYCLKPCHNTYSLETRLDTNYPVIPPVTRIITPIRHSPHLLEGQTMCLWRQGSTRDSSRWDAAKFTCVFAIQAAWRWLACYEVWHTTGEWPMPDAR